MTDSPEAAVSAHTYAVHASNRRSSLNARGRSILLAGLSSCPRPAVWHLTLRWRAELDRALAPMGLTSAQYGVLASLHGLSQGGAQPSQRELADFAGLEPMHVSKLVRALQRAGLVERTENPEDTRAVQLHVTDSGLQVVRAGPRARDGAELARTHLRAIGRRRPV